MGESHVFIIKGGMFYEQVKLILLLKRIIAVFLIWLKWVQTEQVKACVILEVKEELDVSSIP